MEEILKKPYEYVLSKTNSNDYILSVVCGTVGIFEVDITLSIDQIKKYENSGEEFLDELAAKVRSNPKSYL